jgi:hypothetical protein
MTVDKTRIGFRSSGPWTDYDSRLVETWLLTGTERLEEWLKDHTSDNEAIYWPNLPGDVKEKLWPGSTTSTRQTGATITGSIAAIKKAWGAEFIAECHKPNQRSVKIGYNCCKCKEYNEYAASNRSDGTYVCYSCR